MMMPTGRDSLTNTLWPNSPVWLLSMEPRKHNGSHFSTLRTDHLVSRTSKEHVMFMAAHSAPQAAGYSLPILVTRTCPGSIILVSAQTKRQHNVRMHHLTLSWRLPADTLGILCENMPRVSTRLRVNNQQSRK